MDSQEEAMNGVTILTLAGFLFHSFSPVEVNHLTFKRL
jgi:hypothetical protein